MKNVWKMYRLNVLIKFFKIKPPYDLNLMYIKVVELDRAYLGAEY